MTGLSPARCFSSFFVIMWFEHKPCKQATSQLLSNKSKFFKIATYGTTEKSTKP
jgi:hypothetical protein